MRRGFAIVLPVMLLVFITGNISCQSSRPASGDEPFQFNLQKGETYTYRMQWEYDTKMNENESKTNMTADYLLKVTAEDDSIETVEITYKRVQLKVSAMGAEVMVDTDTPFIDSVPDFMDITKMMTKMITALKDKSFSMKINREGKIVKVDGFDVITKEMMKAAQVPDGPGGPLTTIAKPPINEENMKEQLERVLFIFPVRKIKNGDTWVKESQLKDNGTVKIKTNYIVTHIEDNLVTLKMKTSIEGPVTSTSSKGTVSGTLVVDSNTGLVVNAELEDSAETTNGSITVIRKGKGKITGKEN